MSMQHRKVTYTCIVSVNGVYHLIFVCISSMSFFIPVMITVLIFVCTTAKSITGVYYVSKLVILEWIHELLLCPTVQVLRQCVGFMFKRDGCAI